MPASNTKIKKICEWCGTRFEAQKISIAVSCTEVFIIGSRPKDIAHGIAPARGMVFEQSGQQFRRSPEDVVLQYVRYVRHV